MQFEWLFERPIAHRGLHDDRYPENSVPAFEEAVRHGYNIEMDVHVCKDGKVVVFHDDNLKRVCGADKFIKDCTLEELKSYSLAGTEYKIPTFEEFLSIVDGKVGILCEIKGLNPFDNSIAAATIKELEGYNGNIALQSFNFGAVMYAKKHCSLPVGELCTWCSLDGVKDRCFSTNFMGKLHICRVSKPQFISYNVRALNRDLSPNKWLKKWSEKLPVIIWTVDNEEKLEDAMQYGNNFIFENMSLESVEAAIGKMRPLE